MHSAVDDDDDVAVRLDLIRLRCCRRLQKTKTKSRVATEEEEKVLKAEAAPRSLLSCSIFLNGVEKNQIHVFLSFVLSHDSFSSSLICPQTVPHILFLVKEMCPFFFLILCVSSRSSVVATFRSQSRNLLKFKIVFARVSFY